CPRPTAQVMQDHRKYNEERIVMQPRSTAGKTIPLAHHRLSILLGLLGSVSAAAGLIAALLLMLGVVEGWTVAHELLATTSGDTVWQTTLQDLGRAPGFLWGWRWVFLALSAVGPALGLIDGHAQQRDRPWRDQVTLLVLLWLAGSAVISYQYINRDQAIR